MAVVVVIVVGKEESSANRVKVCIFYNFLYKLSLKYNELIHNNISIFIELINRSIVYMHSRRHV